jgi:hypothetical protein
MESPLLAAGAQQRRKIRRPITRRSARIPVTQEKGGACRLAQGAVVAPAFLK